MKWVRRIFVYLFSIVLLVSLVGMALATSVQAGLMHPSKIEDWLTQSNLYANLETTVVSKAQSAIANNVSGEYQSVKQWCSKLQRQLFRNRC